LRCHDYEIQFFHTFSPSRGEGEGGDECFIFVAFLGVKGENGGIKKSGIYDEGARLFYFVDNNS
jgi:hypothetical protein